MQDYLEGLNEEQRKAVEHTDTPLLILAGAGSGKTRVITVKIAHFVKQAFFDAREILALTFTKKAANEMQTRAASLEERAVYSTIRTFHSFGALFLRRYASLLGLSSSFTVYDEDDGASLISSLFPTYKKKDALKIAREISFAKDFFLMPDDDVSSFSEDEDFPKIYRAYQQKLRETGNVDFGDLIILPTLALQSNERLRASFHSRYRCIMVDEYQDTNVAQFRFLKAMVNPDTYVCVVGDDDQSIYKFRGANVGNILNFEKEFPGTRLIRLEKNYRSTAAILHAANRVVSFNKNRLGKTLTANKKGGEKPVLAYLSNGEEEARYVARLIERSSSQGGNSSDWAVLYRTNAQSRLFEQEFFARKIPYAVVGTLKFFARKEVKDALAYLAVILNPKDEVAFSRIVNRPARALGEKTKQAVIMAASSLPAENKGNLLLSLESLIPVLSKKAAKGAADFTSLIVKSREKLERAGESKGRLSVFVKEIIDSSGLYELYKKEEGDALENLGELCTAAHPYEADLAGLLDFMDSVNLDGAEEREGITGVSLITLHNTKGLEFSNVIITGLEEGIFPRFDKSGEELEEERRLFYVGITRAKERLFVTSVSERAQYGRFQRMAPSIFLEEAKDAFDVIGEPLRSYRYDSFPAASRFKGSEQRLEVNDEAAVKYKKGEKVFVDDEGYGYIVECRLSGGEIVIRVRFENGSEKVYLPKYQAARLTLIR